MKKYLYIFRHGETDHMLAGRRDCAIPTGYTVDEGMHPSGIITDFGDIQVNELADYLSDKNLQIIYSSPYDRAIHTANGVATRYNDLQIITDDDFREGIYFHPEWGESYENNKERIMAVYNRISGAIEKVLNTDYTNVAIASHGGITRCILDIAGVKMNKIGPCVCFVLSYYDGKWELLNQFTPTQRHDPTQRD